MTKKYVLTNYFLTKFVLTNYVPKNMFYRVREVAKSMMGDKFNRLCSKNDVLFITRRNCLHRKVRNSNILMKTASVDHSESVLRRIQIERERGDSKQTNYHFELLLLSRTPHKPSSVLTSVPPYAAKYR